MEEWRRTHRWGELTRSELTAARDAGAVPILPLGAVEQHANHLPVDTDALGAEQVSLRAAKQCSEHHFLVLPAQSFGFSPHHDTWPGTITLGSRTLISVLEDIGRSLHRTGFRKMLIVNGHGGNEGPILSACNTLICDGVGLGYINYFNPGKQEWLDHLPGAHRDIGHACAYETGLHMALRPEAAALIGQKIEGLEPRLETPFSTSPRIQAMRQAGFNWAWLFGPGDVGYYGDPGLASEDVGRRLLDATVSGLAGFLRDFAEADFNVGPTPSQTVNA